MKRFISNLLTVCFICYMILLVYFLFFSEEYGRNEPYTTYQYNLELFREIKRYLMYLVTEVAAMAMDRITPNTSTATLTKV